MNIDLKGYTNKYYNNICGAKLEPVLDTIALASKYCHIEITTLMVSGENDSIDEIENIVRFGDNDNLSAIVSVLTDADLLIAECIIANRF